MGTGTGTEWVVDATDCLPARLRDLRLVRELLGRLVDQLSLHTVGDGLWHQFPGEAGVTGLLLLRESHLTVHTYPEHRLATLNLYSCGSRAAWSDPPDLPAKAVFEHELRTTMGASRVHVRLLRRGLVDVGSEAIDAPGLDREGSR